ncbi:DUF397 domain-containing protein [Plantactinospora soyae]|uniref:DUF397 domain-containing protein n=1 Tax=Plantactinospora soyae TaxID=1544732 RepID=A0A927M709_9ACTN|nr:DUF397 domain-containing protein [Plantactinospora soyae]MBE1487776.1 hypothetical protein [Plantactinospora soyae]
MPPETNAPLASAAWRKSTRSGDQGACIEFAQIINAAPDTTIAIRDSKDTTGPVLTFSPAAWTAFTTALPASPILP